MIRAGTKYLRSFSIGLRGALEYRVNFVFSLLGGVSPVIIQTALWTCLYGTGSAEEELFGFTYARMLGYVIVANIVSRLVRTGFEYDLNDDIKSGSLDRYLVKPIDYFGFRLAQFAGAKSAQTVFMGTVLAAALAILSAMTGLPLTPAGVFGFAAALVFAFTLNFLVFWCVGLLGFWFTEIGFLFEAARIVIITASGGIFPLEVFGPAFAAVLEALPFRFTIQFPTDVLCGRVAGGELLAGLGVALLWTLLLAALARAIWARGVRRFAAVGS